jgi:long-chain acyl-CoA synthetase
MLTFYRGRQCQGRLDRAALWRRVRAAMGRLRQLGVEDGDRVAIASPNQLDVPALLLAIWRLGAIAVPLNPGARDDWPHILEHAGAIGCVAARPLVDAVPRSPVGFVEPLESCVETTPTPTPMPLPSPDAPAMLLYTSGTTARPKGVVLSRRNLVANALGLARRFGLLRTTQLAVLPLYHAHALGFGLMTALVSRGHLVFTDGLDPFAWAEVARAESATVASVVPPMLSLLLQARIDRARVPGLSALLVSSAPLPRELARAAVERAGLPLVHGWGLSEFTNFACCLDGQLSDEERRARLCAPLVPSVGAPLDGTEVSVRDPQGRPLGEGEEGELWVRGESRMLGYWHDPAATRQILSAGWLRTGDLGRFELHAGRPAFQVTGRIKEIIIRDGDKHSPLAIEERLLVDVPELAGRLVVLGFSHAVHGEEVGAYLEGEPPDAALERRLLRAIERLPIAQRPKAIVHASAPIPRTHTGKIQRRKLQPLFASFERYHGAPRLIALSSAAPPDSAPGSPAGARSPD